MPRATIVLGYHSVIGFSIQAKTTILTIIIFLIKLQFEGLSNQAIIYLPDSLNCKKKQNEVI